MYQLLYSILRLVVPDQQRTAQSTPKKLFDHTEQIGLRPQSIFFKNFDWERQIFGHTGQLFDHTGQVFVHTGQIFFHTQLAKITMICPRQSNI
jgi:hypothetical protein